MSLKSPLVGNVIIAEDHPFYADGLEKALIDSGIAINVYKTSNGNEVLKEIRQKQIDLIFMDCRMPLMDGITCTLKVKELFPAIKIISLSATCSHEKITSALNAGSDGFFTKEMNIEKLIEVVTCVLKNEKPICDEAKLVLSQKVIESFNVQAKIDFSDREKEIGYILTKGKTLQYAADTLFISYSTARTHKERMFEKTGVNNKASLIAFLIETKVFENYTFPHKLP